MTLRTFDRSGTFLTIYYKMAKFLFPLILIAALSFGCTKTTTPVVTPITVSVSNMSVLESTGILTLSFQLSQALPSESSFTLITQDGTAQAGVDYNTPSTDKVVFPPGVTTKSLSIALLNDHIKRPDRQFSVSLTNAFGGLSFGQAQAAITINNDNTVPEIVFSPAAQVVQKTDGNVSITLELSVPATREFDVPYSVSGTAIPNVDYKLQSGIATFLPGSTKAIITGQIVNTQTAGLNKTIIISLETISGLSIRSPGSYTIVIEDSNLSLIAVLQNVPTGINNQRTLDVVVSGTNVASYKYKITTTNICSDQTGYSSSPISKTQPIMDSVASLPDGQIFLCVEGVNDQGVFQSAETATVVSWTKNTNPPPPPTLVGITSHFRLLSPGVYTSNAPQVIVELSGLTAGYSVGLYDSVTCNPSNLIGLTQASDVQGSFVGTYVGDGNHALSAILFDQFSQGSACLPILTTYTLDTVIPTVLSVSTNVTPGYYGSGGDIPIQVTFSKTVVISDANLLTVNETPYLTLNTNPNIAVAKYISSSGSVALFDYQPQLFENSIKFDYFSQNALVASGYTIQDLAGNSVYLSLPVPGSVGSISSKVAIIVDTTPPTQITGFSDGVWGPTTSTPLFSWVPSSDPGGSGVAKYQVAIGSSSGAIDILPWTDVLTTNFQMAMTFSAGLTYYGSVRAVDKAGNISVPTFGNGWQVDPGPPSTPTVSISQTSTYFKNLSPTISWTASLDTVSGIDHYSLALGTSQGATDVVGWTPVNAQTLSYVFNYNGLYGVNYFASVQAFDKAGNPSQVVYSPSWLNLQPATVPTPALSFTNLTNVTASTQVQSNTQTVEGLNIGILASVTSDKGQAFMVINGGAPVTSATVNNGDTITIQTTSSSLYNDMYSSTLTVGTAVYVWTVTSWGCPGGYILVPTTASTPEFCVAKYKATTVGSIALSQAGTTPTISDQFTAQISCQANGSKYALISNQQYQSLAQNIELVASNWSSGVQGSGIISGGIINSAVYPGPTYEASANDDDACHGSVSIPCSSSVWNKYRRTLSLSTGDVIWDLSGGRNAQWVNDLAASTTLTSGTLICSLPGIRPSDGFSGVVLSPGFNPATACLVKIPDMTGTIKSSYGPIGIYSGLYQDSSSTWGGLGYISQNNYSFIGSDWLLRGGTTEDESGTQYWHGGLYTTVGYQPNQGVAPGNARCVFTH